MRSAIIATVLILFQLLTLPLSVRAPPMSVTLVACDDTYVTSGSANSYRNYGSETFLRVAAYEFSSVVYEQVTWLKFNLSSIRNMGQIEEATLELHTSTVTQNYTVFAYSSSDVSWTEFTLTYSNQPAFNSTAMSSAIVTSENQWYSWSVVDSVRKASQEVVPVVTVVLRETSLHSLLSSVSFDSKEQSSGGNNAPRLTVQWSNAVPEDYSIFVISLLMVNVMIIGLWKKRRKIVLS